MYQIQSIPFNLDRTELLARIQFRIASRNTSIFALVQIIQSKRPLLTKLNANQLKEKWSLFQKKKKKKKKSKESVCT